MYYTGADGKLYCRRGEGRADCVFAQLNRLGPDQGKIGLDLAVPMIERRLLRCFLHFPPRGCAICLRCPLMSCVFVVFLFVSAARSAATSEFHVRRQCLYDCCRWNYEQGVKRLGWPDVGTADLGKMRRVVVAAVAAGRAGDVPVELLPFFGHVLQSTGECFGLGACSPF